MNILIIDGQGGRLGKLVIERLRAARLSDCITAVGTNSTATAAMRLMHYLTKKEAAADERP